jgi:hypothetical protein
MSHKSRQGRERAATRRDGWPDGRRSFGSVRDAILAVLREADGEMRVETIQAEVERVLGGPVSGFSVADYLRVRSCGPKPLFEHTRHGHYQPLRPGATPYPVPPLARRKRD